MNVPVLPAQRLDRMCRNFHVTFHSTFAERKRLCIIRTREFDS